MDQPLKTDEAHHMEHTSQMDSSSHSPTSQAHHHRPAHSELYRRHESRHHGLLHHGKSIHHSKFHLEARHSREFSDSHESQQPHHHTRSHVISSPSRLPRHFGGSHGASRSHAAFHHHGMSHGGSHLHAESHQHGMHRGGLHSHAESHHSGGPQGGFQPYTEFPHHGRPHESYPYTESYPYSESYHHGRYHPESGHRASDAMIHISSTESFSQRDAYQPGKLLSGNVPHHHDEPQHQAHHYGRTHHLDLQQHRRQSYYGESPSLQSIEEAHHQERPHFHGDRSHVGNQASEYHSGEHPHHREHQHPHKEHHHHDEHPHHREHSRHHYRDSSEVPADYKSHSTAGATPSHLGAKTSALSMEQSHLGDPSYASHVSSKIHPRRDSKESGTWSEDGQFKKHKRTQRTHKKFHSGNILQILWEKIHRLFWGLREMMMTLTLSLGFETFIFIVVCLNTVVLVAETFTELEIRGEWYFMVLDCTFLSIYVIEALLKIVALGLNYFYDPWNNLDFFIMFMAVLDFTLLQINSLSYSFYNHSMFRILKVFKSMRALRAIRVLRRLSILTSLHEVTGTLSGSLPSIIAILILMFTCLFLFSVVLLALFRKSDPKRFQNIFTTLFTLFTMLTLDDWSLIYMDSRTQGAWYIIPILMIYIIIQYFIFLNLVIAVLVDNFQMALLKGLEKEKLEKAARVHEKLLDDSLTELSQADPETQMSEGALRMQFIERMFGTMTDRQRELHFQYLQLVEAVEQHQQKFRSQASVINEIVDIAFEAGEEDLGK